MRKLALVPALRYNVDYSIKNALGASVMMGIIQRIHRPRLRFSLATLLLLLTLCAVFLGYIANRRAYNDRRVKVLVELTNKRGITLVDSKDEPIVPGETPSPKSWWEKLLKENSVPAVDRVYIFDYGPIRDPSIGDAEVSQLSLFPEITRLDISRSDKITDEGLGVVRQLPRLKELYLRDLRNVKGFFLWDAPQVEMLDLTIAVDPSHLPALRRQTKLKTFLLTNAPARDADLDFLASCLELKTLMLHGVPVDGSLLRQFPDSAVLESLSLNGAPVTESNAAELLRFKNLTYLSLGGTPITGEFLASASWPKLRSFDLKGVRLSEQGKSNLASVPVPSQLTYPSNWSVLDFRRYKDIERPGSWSLNSIQFNEALEHSFEVNGYYSPEDSLTLIDRCPAELMAPVIQLQAQTRQEMKKLGIRERKR